MEDFEQMLVCPHCGSTLEYIRTIEKIGGIDTIYNCINEDCDTVVTVKHYFKEWLYG